MPGSNLMGPPGQRLSRSGKNGAMVYGIVMYDFKAERADELEAKAGEAIIVIAQSNPEWFVAKPIGRLGGPGLIPVSFIEIRDMASDKPVANPSDAIKKAGVPRVEEWKKMAAEYKNSSITLGKFEGANAQQQGLESGMERMSLQQQQGHARMSSQNGGYVSLPRHPPRQTQLIRTIAAADEPPARLACFATGRRPAEPLRQARGSALRAHIGPHPPLLLRRGEVLVRHRSRARGRSALGTVPIL